MGNARLTTIAAQAQGQAPLPAGRGGGGRAGAAGGHFDPGPAGNTDPDLNHPYHSGDLPNMVAQASGAVSVTSYTTRINLGGPLSPIDADGGGVLEK